MLFSTFKIGKQLFALDILAVREIKRNLRVTPVDHAPPFIRGLINLRGQIITALDPSVKMGMPPRKIKSTTRYIILKPNALATDTQESNETTSTENIGLLADSIGDVVEAEANEIQPSPPNLGSIAGHFISGVINRDDALIICLNLQTVLADSQATTLP